MSILERRKAKAANMALTMPIAALAVTGLYNPSSHAQALTAGDLIVFQSGTAANPDAATASPLLIDEFTTGSGQSAPAEQYNISNGVAGTDLYSSSNGTNGQLSLSNNGTVVTFGGYVGNQGANNETAAVTRDAVAVDASGTFTEPTYYNDTTSAGNEQVRSAATLDGANYVFGTKDGTYINGGTTPGVTTINNLEVQDYGGVLYGMTAGANTANNSASFYSVNTDGTIGTVYSFNAAYNLNSAADFVLLQSGNDGSVYDTLYVANGSKLDKFDLNPSNNTFSEFGVDTLTTGSPDGIIGEEVGTDGSAVDLFVTTGKTGTVEELVDDSGFGNNISNGSLTETTLLSGSISNTTGIDYYGIALAPQVPEPASAGLLMLCGAGLLSRRRKRRM